MIAELRGAAILAGARRRAPADTGALAERDRPVAALAEAHRPSLRAGHQPAPRARRRARRGAVDC